MMLSLYKLLPASALLRTRDRFLKVRRRLLPLDFGRKFGLQRSPLPSWRALSHFSLTPCSAEDPVTVTGAAAAGRRGVATARSLTNEDG